MDVDKSRITKMVTPADVQKAPATKKIIGLVIAAILLAAGAGVGGYFFRDFFSAHKILSISIGTPVATLVFGGLLAKGLSIHHHANKPVSENDDVVFPEPPVSKNTGAVVFSEAVEGNNDETLKHVLAQWQLNEQNGYLEE